MFVRQSEDCDTQQETQSQRPFSTPKISDADLKWPGYFTQYIFVLEERFDQR